MPVLEDINRSVNSAGKWSSGRYQSTTNSGSYADLNYSELLYRDGTGRRRKTAELPPSPYVREQRTTVHPLGTFRTDYSANPQGRWQVYEGPYNQPAKWQAMRQTVRGDKLSQYSTNAQVKAMSRLDQRDMDLGTALAERGKTAQLLGNVAETALDALRAARRGSGRDMLNAFGLDDARAAGEGFVNTYLTWKYGMTPLLNDVIGATKALARMPSEKWTVSTRSTYSTAGTFEGAVTGAKALFVRSNFFKGSRVSVTARQRPFVREQDIRWSLGLDNPLGTLYEVIPYSFVVDWMFGIGDWLQALNSLKYYSEWEIVTSALQKETILLGPNKHTDSTGLRTTTLTRQGRESSLFLYRTLSRNPIVGLPFKDPRSLTNMANALSLLAAAAYRSDIRPIIRY